jgi:hypothetical protein
LRESVSEVIPVTIVQKTIGAIIIFTTRTKRSPRTLRPAPKSGKKYPTAMPRTTPINT